MTLRMRGSLLAILFALAAPAGAVEQAGVCRVTDMVNRVLAPAQLDFPVTTAPGLTFAVTLDDAAGTIALDGDSITIPSFPMGFSETRVILDFADERFTGTIDNTGRVYLPDVRYTICFGGSGAGLDCVPGNVCSNDVSKICIPGPGAGIGCEAGGVCQGVCSNDQTRTCAATADCVAPGRCGDGAIIPFVADLTTGVSTYGTFTVNGAPLDFGTGVVMLGVVSSTPPEAPIVQDSGVNSFFLSCALDPVPAQAELPAAPSLSVVRGLAKLGRKGPSQADDTLKVKGVFMPMGGVADYAADDLVLAFGPPGVKLLTLRVPAGALKANKKGNRWTLKDKSGQTRVTPAPPGGKPARHKLVIKKFKDLAYQLNLESKGLDLDALGDGDQVETFITLGLQEASVARTARKKKRNVKF